MNSNDQHFKNHIRSEDPEGLEDQTYIEDEDKDLQIAIAESLIGNDLKKISSSNFLIQYDQYNLKKDQIASTTSEQQHSKQQERQKLIEEQDAEYYESLFADQEKERQKQEQEELEKKIIIPSREDLRKLRGFIN
jgi:hypothetical protein